MPQPTLHDELLLIEHAIARSDGAESDWDAWIDDEFFEFGASGRAYDKVSILPVLRTPRPGSYSIESFAVAQLTPDLALATYTLRRDPAHGQPALTTRRSSLFIFRGGRWRLRFHQGTPVPNPD